MTLKDFIDQYDLVGYNATEQDRIQIRDYLINDGFPEDRIMRSYRSTDTYIYIDTKRLVIRERAPFDPDALIVPGLARFREIYDKIRSRVIAVPKHIGKPALFIRIPDGFWSAELGKISNSTVEALYNSRIDANDPDIEV